MKTLIVYATKYGATRQIAESIAAEMDDAVLCDLGNGERADLDEYDCVIIGSPLMAGAVRKEVKAFAMACVNELVTKRLGIFLSGMQAEGLEEYLSNNFLAELLDAAAVKALLGGIYDPKKCGFFARLVMKMAAKHTRYTSTIDAEKVKAFARQMNDC